MRASVRILSRSILGVAVGLSGTVARAADTEGVKQALELRTKLELDELWREYQRKADTRPFAQFVEVKYRKRRDVGRGLVFGGAGVGLIGAAVFFLALPRTDSNAATYASYPLMGASVVMMIVGGVLWRKNFRRLERLEPDGYALGPRGRLRLQSAGPVALPRGAGVSFGLAF